MDSLNIILKKTAQACPEPCPDDTNKVYALMEMAQLLSKNKSDSALILVNQAQSLAKKISFKKGEAIAEIQIGRIYYFKQNYQLAISHYQNAINHCKTLLENVDQSEIATVKKLLGKAQGYTGLLFYTRSEYSKALEYYFKGLKSCEEANDTKGIMLRLGGIANTFFAQSDYPNALNYYLKGLKLAEKVNDKQEIGISLGNIGAVYDAQLDYTQALKYYSKGLEIAEEMGDKNSTMFRLGNIGGVYYSLSDYPNAIDYYLKTLKIAEELGDENSISIQLTNIANVFNVQLNFAKALEYYSKSLEVSERIGNKQMSATIYGNIGSLLTKLKEYKRAEVNLNKALLLTQEIGSKESESSQLNSLSHLYEKTNRPALALKYFKMHMALKDSIFSQENSKKLMRTEMDHEYEKKKAVADAEHKVQIENQKLVTAEKEKKQNIIIASVAGGLFLVIIFAGFVFRSLRITSKQKQIIEIKNKETEHQKKEIEEKQKEILDSIRYAKRIQMAQIPSEKQVGKNLDRLRKI